MRLGFSPYDGLKMLKWLATLPLHDYEYKIYDGSEQGNANKLQQAKLLLLESEKSSETSEVKSPDEEAKPLVVRV